jgi:hypothetical protein
VINRGALESLRGMFIKEILSSPGEHKYDTVAGYNCEIMEVIL